MSVKQFYGIDLPEFDSTILSPMTAEQVENEVKRLDLLDEATSDDGEAGYLVQSIIPDGSDPEEVAGILQGVVDGIKAIAKSKRVAESKPGKWCLRLGHLQQPQLFHAEQLGMDPVAIADFRKRLQATMPGNYWVQFLWKGSRRPAPVLSAAGERLRRSDPCETF